MARAHEGGARRAGPPEAGAEAGGWSFKGSAPRAARSSTLADRFRAAADARRTTPRTRPTATRRRRMLLRTRREACQAKSVPEVWASQKGNGEPGRPFRESPPGE